MTPLKRLALGLSLFISMYSYADDYYWVGGSGNWSDISHWVTTSGGNVYHTQLPGSTDDIYFDSNSGLTTSDTVFFTVQTNFCHDLSINITGNAPAFYGGVGNVLRV